MSWHACELLQRRAQDAADSQQGSAAVLARSLPGALLYNRLCQSKLTLQH